MSLECARIVSRARYPDRPLPFAKPKEVEEADTADLLRKRIAETDPRLVTTDTPTLGPELPPKPEGRPRSIRRYEPFRMGKREPLSMAQNRTDSNVW